MKKESSILAGDYTAKLEKKYDRLINNGPKKKKRRILILLSTVLISAAAIGGGVSNKVPSMEKEYSAYCETKDRSLLNASLFDYLDTKEIFEKTSLGNTIIQTHMNGYFYDDEVLSIYPECETNVSVIKIGGDKKTLCDGYASDVSVLNGKVFFRDPETLTVKVYDISTGKTGNIAVENMGPFAVCDELIFYVDTKSNELKKLVDGTDSETVLEDVVEFSIIGNEFLVLNHDGTLHMISMDTTSDVIIGRNINTYLFDGLIWAQNNSHLYSRRLVDNILEPIEFDGGCNRLLGCSDDYVYIDSENGIGVIQKDTHEIKYLDENLIFVGASQDGRMFVYNSSLHQYQMIEN